MMIKTRLNKLLMCAIIIQLLGVNVAVAQNKSNKVLDAVMAVYDSELANNPHDINVLFARANQYMMNGDYLNALSDVNEALKYTTRDDNELLFEEYLLRAKIYEIRKNYGGMQQDSNEALKLNPQSLPAMFAHARSSYELGDYPIAKIGYQNILRLNTVNYDALAGMAKVAVKEKNFGSAKEYVDRAVTLYPSSADVYLNRADVLFMLGEDNAAVHDLINAITIDYENTAALQSIIKRSEENYPIVMEAMDDAVSKAPNSGLLIYLRCRIALNHNSLKDAYKDINTLINNNLYTNAGIYFEKANVLYNSGKNKEALAAIETSIMKNASSAESYVLKSKIMRALSDNNGALDAVKTALSVDINSIEALTQKVVLLMDEKKNKEALSTLNEVIMYNPSCAYTYLLRAKVKTLLNDAKGANDDYARLLLLDKSDIKSYRGFALSKLGRNAEAKTWVEDVVNEFNEGGGEKYFIAAALYNQCGDSYKALDYLEGALANGYGSIRSIKDPDAAGIDLLGLQSDPKFASLLKQYKNNFIE